MSPSARSVESKRKRMPRKRKVKPKNIRPVPILVLSETILIFCVRIIIIGPWRWSLTYCSWPVIVVLCCMSNVHVGKIKRKNPNNAT